MKLDRLLSIVILLLNRRMVQAKELADRFEVSVRTIYRDIEAINQSGIPIVTYQGTNGGIGLADGYKLDRNVLTNDELASIVTALRSISTTYDQRHNQLLMEKLTSIVTPDSAEAFHKKANQVLIDYSPWDKRGPLEQKQAVLKEAIDHSCLVQFRYSNAEGELSQRTVEPHTLIWKGKHWYLQAYCQEREQFRIFKLLRMKELTPLTQTFIRKTIPVEDERVGEVWYDSGNHIAVTLQFHPQAVHLAEEWFDIEELEPLEGGGCLVRMSFPENEWLYGFLLSFGPAAEVLHPPHLREILEDRAARILHLYRNNQT
ncbi:YafY family transcriptional regulator [Paenibacillus sp. 1011MAR3C5]|uniref:helix-turn-helix transcriptional regulator n=1 Tax=Paenibacillus sp. 1011MAR3C5 TaxID=1675787 RepID=UPI000E6B7BE6|nr:YafY family protein [Paenibacillus sp. 1011MAR3C5]RJE86131.1 YafY family transcriptional regulator [Paenibacillus sp. 1011MAR3C5]